MKRMQARVNTYVPAELKEKLDSMAESAGIKSSDLLRLSLSFALDHFEDHGISIGKASDFCRSSIHKKGGRRYV